MRRSGQGLVTQSNPAALQSLGRRDRFPYLFCHSRWLEVSSPDTLTDARADVPGYNKKKPPSGKNSVWRACIARVGLDITCGGVVVQLLGRDYQGSPHMIRNIFQGWPASFAVPSSALFFKNELEVRVGRSVEIAIRGSVQTHGAAAYFLAFPAELLLYLKVFKIHGSLPPVRLRHIGRQRRSPEPRQSTARIRLFLLRHRSCS